MKNDVHVRAIDSRRTEISTNVWKAIVVKRVRDTQNSWSAKTRIYGAVAAFAPDLEEKIHENACSPAWGEGDGFTAEQRDEHMKAYRALKREALDKVKTALAEPIALLHAYGLGRLDTDFPTARFSVKAGCSMCACSPGHILNARWTLAGVPVDVWLERVGGDSKGE